MKNKKHILLAFLLLVLVAGFFRFYLIAELPGGLFPDEAANGLDVNFILDGQAQPFYERGNGREALFFYFLAAAVHAFGRTPLTHHLASALFGFATVLLTFLLARRWFNDRVAIMAAFLTATSAWHVMLSRTAFRAITAPVFALLFFIFATRVIQAKSRKDYWLSAMLAGVSLSLGAYTYISFRMMVPLLMAAFIILLLIDLRRSPKFALTKKYASAFFAGLAASVVTFLPLGWFFIKHPEWLVGRGGQVSIFSPELNQGDLVGTFLRVLGQTIDGFFFFGDVNWRHNVAGVPFLSPLIAALFAVGIIYIVVKSTLFVVRAIKGEEGNLKLLPLFLLTAWFFLMLIPEVLTAEGIPHGLRLIGVIPAVFIIPALAFDKIVELAKQRLPRVRTGVNEVAAAALIVILALELVFGFHLYFRVAAESPEYYAAFRSDLTVVSEYLNARNDKSRTYLVTDYFSEQTPQYMTTETGQPYHVIDPATLWLGPDNVRIDRDENEYFGLDLKGGDQVVFTQTTIFDAEGFERHFPDANQVLESKNKWGEIIMQVYEY